MFLIKNQNYSFSGISAICDENEALHLKFSLGFRRFKSKPIDIHLLIDTNLALSVVKQGNHHQTLFCIDIQLSALFRYSAYCPEAKPRLAALWNKHIGNYETYKANGLDQLGYLLCVIEHPEITEFVKEPFTLMLLCEAIIAPTRACNVERLVTLKRPEIIKTCVYRWFVENHPQFDPAQFPEKFTTSVYRFCQRLRPQILTNSDPLQIANAKAMGALLRISKEPQLISRLQHIPTIGANNLVKLESYARLPYSHWLKLQEAEAASFCDTDTASLLVDDIDGMAKELGSSLKKCLLESKTLDDLEQLHDRLVTQLNQLHRKAQLTDAKNGNADPYGDDLFPPCRLLLPVGIQPLNSANLLRNEGVTMRHCVGGLNYIKRARAGLLNFFHVEHNGHHATLEIDARDLTVQQFQSFDNSIPHPELTRFVQAWLEHEKNRLIL